MAEPKETNLALGRPCKVFRLGHVSTLEGTDLVVWLKHEATEPVDIMMEKQ